ncbi:MAG: OmpA family protein [Cyanobacteria bacterium P01_H01_bin.119]
MMHFLSARRYQSLMVVGLLVTTLLSQAIAWAQDAPQPAAPPVLHVVVNSNQDGPIQADDGLTLREAIELTNGTLSLAALSPVERAQVVALDTAELGSRIEFDLPAEQTQIQVMTPLPAIASPNLTLDGSTQPGYNPNQSATAEIEIPIPIVELTPAADAEVFRGLSIVASGVTVRGLSLYGFTARHRATAITPPADIFIAHRLPPPDTTQQYPPAQGFSYYDENVAPEAVLIEHNWLGMPPTEAVPAIPSAFGVSVFNSQGTTVRRNYIVHHDGSGIITGARAEHLKVEENIIVGNGLAGMPDGIRLEGIIDNSVIRRNLMCGNDGAGIFLFKPEGAATIQDNTIKFNGQRLRRAAIYLMGDGHRVTGNTINNQKGSGVVVTAFGHGSRNPSHRNLIQTNRFTNLEGLSIDLNTRRHSSAQDFQRGDGPNPVRNSDNRRLDTGNLAINAPQFLSPEFFVMDGKVLIEGVADPGSEIEIYLSHPSELARGPLTQPLATVPVDETGRFQFASEQLQPGTVLSAIASDPRYGTSEPALNTVVRSLSGADSNTAPPSQMPDFELPHCTTRPQPPAPVVVAPPEPIQLQVPRNIHFGLDREDISAESAAVLNQIAAAMQTHPTLIVDLHGHTDSRASDAYNQELALRRARSARAYLIQQGIDPARMTIRSLGETQLLTSERDRVEYARNRRVEFVFEDVRGLDITFVDQDTDLQIEP